MPVAINIMLTSEMVKSISKTQGQLDFLLVCTNGLTKCAFSQALALKETTPVRSHVCHTVSVYIYNGEEGNAYLNLGIPSVHSSLPLLVWAGIPGSAMVGTSALIMGYKKLKELSSRYTLDHLEILFPV